MEKLPSSVPSAKQLQFQEWNMGLFLHFGIRTFNEGFTDFDHRKMELDTFNPIELNCEQWMETAQKAGLQYAVLTAKHHDGFANWPSKFTDYSVANTPWKNGQGDVIREYVDACRKYGIKPGLYYSPADTSTDLIQSSEKDYDQYFIDQISELLTGYGEIDILWFDGCGSENHTYDWPRIIGDIRRMQPNILIFNMGDPDFRWIGNEAGLAPWPSFNTEETVPFSILSEERDDLGGQVRKWLPYECNFRMRNFNWFYSEKDEHTVKSLDELMGIYYYSVGRGGNMLINIGPDRRGHLPEQDTSRLLEFGGEIRRRFAEPIARLQSIQSDSNEWVYSPERPILVNHVVLREDLTKGEHVAAFEISVKEVHTGSRITVYQGRNVGLKAICRFAPVMAQGVIIKVTLADGTVYMRDISLYFTGES